MPVMVAMGVWACSDPAPATHDASTGSDGGDDAMPDAAEATEPEVVHTGTAGLVLRGTIVLPAGPIVGEVLVEGNAITCAAASCPSSRSSTVSGCNACRSWRCWGGFATVRLAAHMPECIERLALLVPAGIVNGHAWQGTTRLMIPMMLWRMFPTEQRFAKFARNLLTTMDDDWLPYLHDAFRSFNMDMRVPKLATPEELAAFKAPTLVMAGDQDVNFPGDKLATRAKQLFGNLASVEIIPNCNHCPPTTPEFHEWLAGRVRGLLEAPGTVAAAS